MFEYLPLLLFVTDLVRKWIQEQQEEIESQKEALGTSDQIISDLMKQSQGV